jgi:hypothetical protein
MFKFFNRLYDITWFGEFSLINHKVVYEKLKLFQTRLFKYNPVLVVEEAGVPGENH